MALLILDNGSKQVISAEQGRTIWGVLSGKIKPTPEQEKYCLKVKKVFLNWRNAPDSYIKQYFEIMVDLATLGWMADKEGNITQPEPADAPAWNFAKRWGLWENGNPTVLIVQRNQRRQMGRWVKPSKPKG